MPKRLYEFQCVGEDAHVFEKFCDEDLKTAICPECGELSNRIISAVRSNLEGWSGNFPGAAMAWERKRAEKLKQERKQNS
jgi:predicted nucleic acid-binding Zn ribbon protein